MLRAYRAACPFDTLSAEEVASWASPRVFGRLATHVQQHAVQLFAAKVRPAAVPACQAAQAAGSGGAGPVVTVRLALLSAWSRKPPPSAAHDVQPRQASLNLSPQEAARGRPLTECARHAAANCTSVDGASCKINCKPQAGHFCRTVIHRPAPPLGLPALQLRCPAAAPLTEVVSVAEAVQPVTGSVPGGSSAQMYFMDSVRSCDRTTFACHT